MRVAGHDALAPDEAEEEAEHDLADAVALGLLELRDLVESQPVDVLRDEDAPGREICVHARHANMRVVPEQPRKAALVLGFDLIVELIGDPLAHLGQQRSGVGTRRQPLNERAHNPDRAQVARDLVGDLRVLNLHGNALAVPSLRTVDLTEGGKRERLLVEGREYVLHAGIEILLDHTAQAAQRKRFSRPRQRAQRTRGRLT